MIKPYRTIRIATPGIIQPVVIDPAEIQYMPVHGVLIQVLPANQGRMYIGNSAMDRGTLTNMYAFLAVPTINIIPAFSAALTLAPNAIQLKDFYIDADSGNDGVIVTVLVA